ncbi:hypothetical protein ACIPRL_36230 [Streptomyces sp. NPDC090085]|uniref:hypothetical protein n=1 Tax=unclassified Streptomyces TaxID=2593676 RepID=UPI003441CD25
MSTARARANEDEAGFSSTVNDFFDTLMGDARPGQDERPDDRLIAGMQRARTLLGLAAAVWLVLAYPLTAGRQDFILGKLFELAVSCAILLTASTIGIVTFLAAGTPDRRRDFTRRLLGPFASLLALALGPTVFWLSFKGLKGELLDGSDTTGFFAAIVGRGVLSALLGFLALAICWLLALALFLASIPYTLVVAYACIATCFRASDVHQLLPALLSPFLMWSLFVFQTVNGPDIAAPPEVLYTFLLGGPLTVTALSVWEVRRLRSRWGITLRGALGR